MLFAVLAGLGPWAAIGFPLLSAAVMVQKGFHVNDSLWFAGVSMLGPTVGIGAAALAIDWIERRVVLCLCAGAMAVLGLGFAAASGFAALTALGTGFNLLSALYSVVMSLYAAELFATPLRATATATTWSVGRAVSVFVPIVLLPVLGTYGPLAMFAIVTAALLTCLLLIAGFGPAGRAGQAVE